MSEPRDPEYEPGEEQGGSWDELLESPAVVADMDSDGTPDTLLVDVDQDSVIDTALVDTDGDAVVDVAVVDTNADSVPDAVVDVSADAAGVPSSAETGEPGIDSPGELSGGPGYPDPFETPEAEAHIDASYEMPEYLETASDDEFRAAMDAEQQELENIQNTPLS
jgi:hypothetical protein